MVLGLNSTVEKMVLSGVKLARVPVSALMSCLASRGKSSLSLDSSMILTLDWALPILYHW